MAETVSFERNCLCCFINVTLYHPAFAAFLHFTYFLQGYNYLNPGPDKIYCIAHFMRDIQHEICTKCNIECNATDHTFGSKKTENKLPEVT